TLTPAQTWGTALAGACFLRHAELRKAVLADAMAAGITDATIDDARASASIMGMNTVYYRFRHMVGKPSYGQRPARLRMQRMAQPLSSKADFELMSMACAVLAGCEMCVKAHEASILQHGLTEDHVHDAVRIAAVLNGVVNGLATAHAADAAAGADILPAPDGQVNI
ncbi:MAG: alkyl hydroperoxide reductase, partial [Phycisphaerales bacterium]|nr:alkyl hydroperoxide reductase [Phycisphaerales bacterium]